MGMLWDIIQHHIDTAPYPPSINQLARKLGVAPNTLANWRDSLQRLPARENLEAIAALVGVRYSVVLDAALYDAGYHESASVTQLRRRPVTTVEAELRAARATLDEFDELGVPGAAAEGKRAELAAKVKTLEAELAASRQVTGETGSVAKM